MNEISAQAKLAARIAAGFNLCVGFDTDIKKIPISLKPNWLPRDRMMEFNRLIMNAVAPYAAAFKPNIGFYLSEGGMGAEVAQVTFAIMKNLHPEILSTADIKSGDIGNTSEMWAKFVFDYLNADAVTLSPYMGKTALQPFLDRKDKLNLILCCTSNDGADEFQDLFISDGPWGKGHSLYEIVAGNVHSKWNENGNCGLVTGATVPEKLAKVRKLAPDLPLLIPGVGTQQGELEQSVKNAGGENFLVNVSRDIMYHSSGEDFVEAAVKRAKYWHEQIQKARFGEIQPVH